MRTPISWLRDFVDLDSCTEHLAERLSIAGIEIDEHYKIGAFHPLVVVAAVIANRPHDTVPGGSLLKVDAGSAHAYSTLSMAPNAADARPGSRIAVALPGASVLTGGDLFNVIEVETALIHGVQSEVVVLSEREVGIGNSHSGVLFLDASAEPGRPVLDYLTPKPNWESDEVIELAILANIARCQSVRGLAREIAAITGGRLHDDVTTAQIDIKRRALDGTAFDVKICRRFTDLVVEGVIVQPSPRWLQRRLRLAGLSPTNNVVDAANYVMVELGQPMHTYDLERLPDRDLNVRPARAGERLHVLSQPLGADPLELTEGLPLVVSRDQPVAIAGIVGGTETAVSVTTRSILVESANFDLIQIRKGQAAAKVTTQASARFSRGVDPSLTTLAIARFVYLLSQTVEGLRLDWMRDASLGIEDVRRTISLSIAESNAALGVDMTASELRGLLERVGIETQVDAAGEELVAIVTSARQDLMASCDLMEEAVRLHGYDRLPETMPVEPIPTHPRNNHFHMRERARDALVLVGLQEIVTYSLTSPEQESKIADGDEADSNPPYVRLLNPISSERTAMRRSLLPEMLSCVRRNLRYSESCHLFEIGQVFLPELGSGFERLPAEPYRVAVAMVGPIEPSSMHRQHQDDANFFDIAEAVVRLVEHLHVDGVTLKAARHAPFNPTACAAVTRGEKVYGYLGLLHARVARSFDLDSRKVVCADLDLDALIADAQRFFVVSELLQQPSIVTDISVVVDEAVPAGRLRDIVKASAERLVRAIEIFDVYRGKGIPENRKAVGIRFTLNAGDRTLTTAEEREVFERVVERLHKEIGAELRT